ncbi:DNA polymerase III subunit alpha [Patulibacter americanus]|uniref:DNA polymerase III subunit alpha n=1 Tax=Patulibacter americanus TaxID=588672 RepID=UPI000424A3A0|nr:PHP domain-containing protein [Patulibacter americanus]
MQGLLQASRIRRLRCEHTFVPGAPYVELHCHSAYSFLDGASLPEELVLAAARQGHDALALTDHDGVYGAMEFAHAAAAHGIRAIHGAEVTVRVDPSGVLLPPADMEPDPATRRHLTLLVKDARGWENLCRLLTRAHAHTRDHPRRVRTAPWVHVADVCELHEGLVCLSGCADHGVEEEPTLKVLRDAFGPEDLYVELQRRYLRGDRERGRRRERLAHRLGLRCVATGDVHAHSKERALLQDALVAIRRHTTLDASEPARRGNHSHVLATPRAMVARLEDHPEAVAETVRLAERLRFDLTQDLGYHYPGAEDAEAGRRLAAVCDAAFQERFPHGHRHRRKARERLDEELALIGRLDLPGFFVLHHEILELAREVAFEVRGRDGSSPRAVLPPGRGRGSSVSSVVCYLTGLSHVDPIESGLSLGRFLNDDVSGVPDIDLDFPRDVRAELIPRVHQRYGTDRAALVAAFPTYRARGAIREIGAALGLPAAELERVARSSEGWSGHGVADDIAMALGDTPRADDDVPYPTTHPGDPGHPSRREERAGGREAWGDGGVPMVVGGGMPDGPGVLDTRDAPEGLPVQLDRPPRNRWEWLAKLSSLAHGLPRHLSQHPGGMVVATRPLVACCPVVPASMAGRQMVMWDKDSCSDAGFLKIDLLGLGMLSSVERCVELISDRRGEQVDLSRIPLDDPETFGTIQRAETTGVFQIESRAQMGSLLRTRPETLEDLTIQVAIVRPGPIQGGAVNPYIERRQRQRQDPTYEPPYLHPSLKPVMEETLGTIIFQDQVIDAAMAFAGFTAGQAEGLRRAMSRKRSQEAIDAHYERFVQGAMETHGDVTPEVAQRVWEMIRGFSGFGFPKAHGAAFGLLAYQSTWLRVHYGPEFLCSLLDEQPMGFYPPDALIHDAQRRGITVLPPDVRVSRDVCTVEDDGAVRVGLGYIKGVRAEDVAALVAEREAHGPWASLADMAGRLGSGLPSLERLAWSGACDGLAGDEGIPAARRRRAALWRVGAVSAGRRVAAGTQLALGLESVEEPSLSPMSAWERLIADYDTTALTTGIHPLALLRERLSGRGVVASGELGRLRHGTPVRVGGLVLARQRPGSAKGVVFLLLEDELGTVNLVIPPAVYTRERLAVRTEPLVVAEGRLERHPSAGGQINVVVRRIRALDDVMPEAAQEGARQVTRLQRLSPEELERWRQEQASQGLVAVGGGVAVPAGGGRDGLSVAAGGGTGSGGGSGSGGWAGSSGASGPGRGVGRLSPVGPGGGSGGTGGGRGGTGGGRGGPGGGPVGPGGLGAPRHPAGGPRPLEEGEGGPEHEDDPGSFHEVAPSALNFGRGRSR